MNPYRLSCRARQGSRPVKTVLHNPVTKHWFYSFAYSAVVFCLPCESKEKIKLSVSVLMAHLFYLVALFQKLPASSTNQPLVAIYTLFNMVIILLSISATTVVINANSKRSRLQWWEECYIVFHPFVWYSTIINYYNHADNLEFFLWLRSPSRLSGKPFTIHLYICTRGHIGD